MLKTIKTNKSINIQHSDSFLNLCENAKSNVQEITLETFLQQKERYMVIDIRDTDELNKQGYIDGAYHISKGWIEAHIHHIATDKQTEIILYCGSGKRSLLAGLNLHKMGYCNVKSLQGGFKGYKQSGLPVCFET